MAEFEVEGKIYDTEGFSGSQKSLLNSLSITKGLIDELNLKNKIFLEEKEKLEKKWKKDFGSKIKDISQKSSDILISLSNGKKLKYSQLSEPASTNFQSINFLNERIMYHYNQLQVLDTARLVYSKSFYEALTGATGN